LKHSKAGLAPAFVVRRRDDSLSFISRIEPASDNVTTFAATRGHERISTP